MLHWLHCTLQDVKYTCVKYPFIFRYQKCQNQHWKLSSTHCGCYTHLPVISCLIYVALASLHSSRCGIYVCYVPFYFSEPKMQKSALKVEFDTLRLLYTSARNFLFNLCCIGFIALFKMWNIRVLCAILFFWTKNAKISIESWVRHIAVAIHICP